MAAWLAWVTPVSSANTNCVALARCALKSVGSATASSNELVCRLCVPPSTPASAWRGQAGSASGQLRELVRG